MRTLVIVLACLSLSSPTWAHHWPGAEFDLRQRQTVSGTVLEYHFVNPHSMIVFEVVTDSGEAERWVAEGANAGALRRLGWNGRELRAGDQVSVVGNPAKDGSNRINWQTLTLSNDRLLGGGNGTFILPAVEARWQRWVASQRQASENQ